MTQGDFWQIPSEKKNRNVQSMYSFLKMDELKVSGLAHY
jgi:hypothetical protein